METASNMLEVKNLTVSVPVRGGGRANVIQNVSFTVRAGGTVGLVGESGSGKTMTSLAVMGLLPAAAQVESGQILLEGEDLLTKSARELQRLRGKTIAMVLQDPMTALDPLFTVRSQLVEPLQQHRHLRGEELGAAVLTSLERVQLSAAKERLRQYPHQLSGGMRQRVTSAIALAGEPKLLVADEPTTALDTITQARYMQMLQELQESTGFALLLIAHDLLLVQSACEQVVVMYAGQIVEEGLVADVFTNPQHPYTRALLGAIPVPDNTGWLATIPGHIPDPSETFAGCRFASRCEFARDVCSTAEPQLTSRGQGRVARCFGTDDKGWIKE
jgi:peptide/nickel transport system ATP-binding protein